MSKTINGEIIIRGEQLSRLEGVEKIDGLLGISDSSIESLGELKEVSGDFWTSFHTVYSPLTSLNNLEKIGGDASLRYSNVTDLGNLKYVGGKLSLRDTKITNLGKLRYVGGDLYLPKRLKGSIDLDGIHIVGKVQFWSDNKHKVEIADKSTLGLTKSDITVPFWPHQYVYSTEVLDSASAEQAEFYRYFKKCFLDDVFIDIDGNENYSFILYYDLLNDYHSHKDIEKLLKYFSNLATHYPRTERYISYSTVKEFEKRGDYQSAWKFTRKREFISVQTIWEYQQKLNTPLLDGDLITRLSGYSHLTDFGQKNIEQIKSFALEYLRTYEFEHNSNFFELFFDKGCLYKSVNSNGYSADYYKKYYSSEAEYHFYKSIDDGRRGSIEHFPFIGHVVEKAVLNQFRLILKIAEDLYRAKIGMPKVGEGWVRETELFYKIVDTFREHEIINHGKPSWLGLQHLDIYFPKLNIGIEYQGSQHYEPVDFFGGQESYEKTRERDQNKRKLCEENSCTLIYVNEDYDFKAVVSEIKSGIQKALHK